MPRYLYWRTNRKTHGRTSWVRRMTYLLSALWVRKDFRRIFPNWFRESKMVGAKFLRLDTFFLFRKRRSFLTLSLAVPQRLINTQCGAYYSAAGSSISFIDYIEPATTAFYKLHPNYFFSSDSDDTATIKVKFSLCCSRTLLTRIAGEMKFISLNGQISCENKAFLKKIFFKDFWNTLYIINKFILDWRVWLGRVDNMYVAESH